MATVFDLVSNLSHQSLQLALNGIWLGVGLSGLAWLLMRHIRGITAATRYTAWWIVLIVTLALPLLMTSPLELWQHNPVDGASSGTTAAYESAETPAGGADAATLHRLHPDRAFELPAVNTSHSSSARQSGNENAIGSMVFRLMPVSLAVIWLAGVLVLGIRLWRAYRELISIKSDSRPLDISRLPRVRAMMERNLHRHVRIGISGKVTSPIAAGLGRPMILIPPRVVEELSEEELEAVILHELAHLIRRDDWTKLAQKVAETVFFFHPAVHIIGRQLELERELA